MNYDKINSYLNDIFVYLSKDDWFLLDNCLQIETTARFMLSFLPNYDNDIKENKMTYMDVYNMAGEIINTINPEYYRDYLTILDSGQLDFAYNHEYGDSFFKHIEKDDIDIINIDRTFNYQDVIILVHEFFHYLNYNKSILRYLLTEYVSIFFEMKSVEFLRDKGIPDKYINPFQRINVLSEHIKDYLEYSKVLIMYEKFGSISFESIELYNKFIYPVTRDTIDSSCLNVIKRFESSEGELINSMKDNYRYILGTVLALYSICCVEIGSVIKLNDRLKENRLSGLGLIDELKKTGIDINDKYFNDKVLAGLYKYLNYDKEKHGNSNNGANVCWKNKTKRRIS